MIKIESKKGRINVNARGDVETLTKELAHGVAAILDYLADYNQMPEEKRAGFWESWNKLVILEMEEICERVKENSPSLKRKCYARKKFPWE